MVTVYLSYHSKLISSGRFEGHGFIYGVLNLLLRYYSTKNSEHWAGTVQLSGCLAEASRTNALGTSESRNRLRPIAMLPHLIGSYGLQPPADGWPHLSGEPARRGHSAVPHDIAAPCSVSHWAVVGRTDGVAFGAEGGLLIDLRSVALLMSGFLGGPVAAIVTVATNGFFRVALENTSYGCPRSPYRRRRRSASAPGCSGVRSHVGAGSPRPRRRLGGVAHGRRHARIAVRLVDPSTARELPGPTFPVAAIFYPIAAGRMGSLLRFEGRRADQAADLESENSVLSERDARFQAVFDLSSVAMIWMSKDGQILRANQRMADLVGYSVDELQSMHYEDQIFSLRIATTTTASGPSR